MAKIQLDTRLKPIKRIQKALIKIFEVCEKHNCHIGCRSIKNLLNRDSVGIYEFLDYMGSLVEEGYDELCLNCFRYEYKVRYVCNVCKIYINFGILQRFYLKG